MFNDYLDAIFYKPLPVAVMLIVYGVLFIVVENRNKGRNPEGDEDIRAVTVQMLLLDWRIPDAGANPGNVHGQALRLWAL